MTRSVLIVDDEIDLLDTLEMILKPHVTNIYRAMNGKEAIEKHAEYHPDVIICDLHMPIMSGQEVLAVLRNSGDETPFIVLTGFADLESSVTALKYGAFDFLSKPFVEDNLIKKVLEAISMNKLMIMAEENLKEMVASGNIPANLDPHSLMVAKHAEFLKLVRSHMVK